MTSAPTRPPLLLTSPKNARIKAVLALADARERAATDRFAVEGAREISRAAAGGYEPVELYTCPEALSDAARQLLPRLAGAPGVTVYEVTPDVYARLAVRERSDGLVAVFRQRHHALADLRLPPTALVLAVQGVEKPGNLGALLRTADGAGVDAVVLLDRTLDLYNPNVLRASLGAAFALPVVAASSAEFRAYCAGAGLRVIAAALTDRAVPYAQADFRGATALLLGEEATGLTETWLALADQCVVIPMKGVCDSLNVSVAGAVLLYEAVRQRGG